MHPLNSANLVAKISYQPQAMRGKELFCSAESFRAGVTLQRCRYMTPYQPLTARTDDLYPILYFISIFKLHRKHIYCGLKDDNVCNNNSVNEQQTTGMPVHRLSDFDNDHCTTDRIVCNHLNAVTSQTGIYRIAPTKLSPNPNPFSKNMSVKEAHIYYKIQIKNKSEFLTCQLEPSTQQWCRTKVNKNITRVLSSQGHRNVSKAVVRLKFQKPVEGKIGW